MNSMNIANLVKVITTVVLLSQAAGKFQEVREYALKAGIRAITMKDYCSCPYLDGQILG